ncbi:Universal stress protein family protein [compost metagenome]
MLRACQRPVIVVRNPADQPYQTLMVAVDFSRVSHRLVELAFALHPTARVELFHAISTANEVKLRYAEVSERTIQIYREECRRHAQDRMFTLTDSYDARRNRLSSSIGRGDPARQVVVQQQNTAADLIVVGKHPASRLSDLLFESVAQRVVRDALADVLVVPNDFQPASRGSAVQRLATDLPVRRVKAGSPRLPSYPNPAALPDSLRLFTNSPAPPHP